jgi:hypothetical protein
VFGVDGKVVEVHYKVCAQIEGKEKLLTPKINYLWKHVRHCKTLVFMPKVKAGEHYFLETIVDVANEKLYFGKCFKIMLQQVVESVTWVDRKKKIVQVALLFHLLNRIRPINEYITMQILLLQLNVFNNPMKHWSDKVGWEMANCL